MSMISDIMDGVVFANASGQVQLMNPAAEELLGLKSFMALGRSFADLEENNDLVATLHTDHATVREEGPFSRTVELHHNEQDLLYIEANTSVVLDHRGDFAGVLSILKDVTNVYKVDQRKNQYLSIVAHELRTPLTGIKTFSTMMAHGALGQLTEDQQEVMESIREQSLRLEHQIDKLINLGNIESNDYGRDLQVVEVVELVAGAVAPFETPARDRSIELELHVPETNSDRPLCIRADQADLKRSLQAIIENAVKFTQDRGRVDVDVTVDADRVLFSVRDTGIGIDPRYHRRIFEKFFQVEDPLTRHHGGAGLGLFVAQGILAAHGSTIEVESELTKGARFTFSLAKYDDKGGSDLDPLATTSSTQVKQQT